MTRARARSRLLSFALAATFVFGVPALALARAGPDGEGHVGRDIVGIYDNGVAHLEKICDDYRRIKALELARLRDIAFDDAYENISSVMPIFAPIDRDLLRKSIRVPSDIQTHKRAVELVEKEVEMMIDLAAKLLEEIEVVQMEMLEDMRGRPDLTLEEIVARPEYDPDAELRAREPRETDADYQALAELAREDENLQAKDLTSLMRPFMDIKDLTQDRDEDDPARMDLFRSSNDLGALPSIVDPETNRVFGRKVQADAAKAEWLFVDTWYTIGPFPNPQRVNLNRKFPPETVVDLDATYIAKDGRRVRWQWVQSNKPEVLPADPEEYAVYYAYTEVYCDRPMDLWVAVGSDDKANVWLNGLPIWISGDRLKGWRANEGFRKVSFKPGINRILYRVENGWLHVAFSFAIRTAY